MFQCFSGLYGVFLTVALLQSCSSTGREGVSGSDADSFHFKIDKLYEHEKILLAEVDEFLIPAAGYIEDSLWFEAAANLDSALEKINYLKSLDSLDSAFYQVLNDYKDSIYSQLIFVTSRTVNIHRPIPWNAYFDIEMEKVTDSQMVAVHDLVKGIRPSDYGLPFTVPVNPRIIQVIAVLTGNGKKYFNKWLNRKSRYEDLILRELEAANVPKELIYLAMVESGFNPQAWSSAKASGVWQFIEETGKRYGLNYDWWIDERRDPSKSTAAAIKYLTKLYNEFGDWHLAMAGYNCGENRIRRRLKEDPNQTFWDMELPKETMNYVPKILAAMIVGENPDKYGFVINPEPPRLFDTVSVSDCLPLSTVAELTDTTLEHINLINPELRRWCTPPDAKTYLLKVPSGTRNKFLTGYAGLDKENLISWHRHIVSKGENLGILAKKYGITIQVIKSTNNLRGNLIRVGQSLLIPIPGNNGLDNNNSSQKNYPAKQNREIRTADITYQVKGGDNLFAIARNHGVSVSSLMNANGLTGGSIIKPGEILTIPSSSPKKSHKSEEDLSPAGFRIYKVKSGDNLIRISRKLNVSVQNLINWNNLKSENVKIGQKLKYDISDEGQEAVLYYIIKPQDNLWDIAIKFKTSINNIHKLNKNLPEIIKPGMKIRVR